MDVHNTSEVLFRLCANTDLPSPGYGKASPQRACPPKPWRRRNSIFIPQPRDPVRRARPRHQSRACGTSGSKLGIDATKKLPGEGFNPDTGVGALIKMDAAVKAKVEQIFPTVAP